ncbi:MAG: hypothetical protein J6Q83_01300 [Clostridia bacterium]|nr:hypothetical protein [Clostridia bacterium]
MISEIVTFAFAMIGLVFTLWFMAFRVTSWRTDRLTISIPLYDDSKEIFDRIYCAYSLTDFCGIKKKCTIVIINYGASEDFCNTIKDFYKNYKFIRLVEPEGLIKELHT